MNHWMTVPALVLSTFGLISACQAQVPRGRASPTPGSSAAATVPRPGVLRFPSGEIRKFTAIYGERTTSMPGGGEIHERLPDEIYLYVRQVGTGPSSIGVKLAKVSQIEFRKTDAADVYKWEVVVTSSTGKTETFYSYGAIIWVDFANSAVSSQS